MIIEIVDIVFTILFDNSSSSSFPLPVFEERELGELVVVVAVNVAATVVVPAGGNGAAGALLRQRARFWCTGSGGRCTT